jgi:seryl-tRNA synthetase
MKLKDFFDVRKYRIKMNTAINKYNSRNADYIKILEDYHELSIKIIELQNQVKELKEERKELKRIINEDMTPKKRK